jgi:hypothetical protein
MSSSARAFWIVVTASFTASCVGDAGGQAIDFPVAAAGPVAAVAGQPLDCSSDQGWGITLTAASLHVGAVYLDQAMSVSGAQATGCYLTGTYVAQETSALDVDLLSPDPQPFPAAAHGITVPSPQIGEVWLTRGYVTAVPSSNPPMPILTVAGTATQSATGTAYPFTGTVTIEQDYQTSGATAGGNPICKKRIVSLIPAPLTIADTGGLLLRVDPCRLFIGVDFSQLPAGATPGTFQFTDDPTAAGYSPTGADLYGNLHSIAPYAFSWTNDL